MNKFFKNKYRVVTDKYLGYEVQVKYWWFPFWLMAGYCNTHLSLQAAVKHAESHSKGLHNKTTVVKEIGVIEDD